MNDHSYEQIQRYTSGEMSAEEIAAFHEALRTEAGLRALYLDYLNLEMALSALAESAVGAEEASAVVTDFPRPYVWRWVAAAAAACAVLVLSILPARTRILPPAQLNLVARIAATEALIARLSVEPPAPMPDWMSPTASMLAEPEEQR